MESRLGTSTPSLNTLTFVRTWHSLALGSDLSHPSRRSFSGVVIVPSICSQCIETILPRISSGSEEMYLSETSLNTFEICCDALILEQNATALRIGSGSVWEMSPSSPRTCFDKAFIQPISFVAISVSISLSLLAIIARKTGGIFASLMVRISTL